MKRVVMAVAYTLFIITVLLMLHTCQKARGAIGDDLRLRPPAPLQIKVDQVKPAIDLICATSVTRAIQRTPATAESVSIYFREVGRVFAATETNGNFTAEGIIAGIDKIPSPLDAEQYVVDVRTLIITLYRLAYEERTRAELPPVEWLSRVCMLFRSSINTGLKDAGRVGI
jgi:hypothetical protein